MSSHPASFPATPKRAAKMAANHSQSLNHLLNFTLPPRQQQPPTHLPRRSRRTGSSHGVWNKERFVNAQYRFVVNPSGDYTVHFADPDIYFQWNDILQVIIPRISAYASAAAVRENADSDEGHTTCPICLSPPTAPRMTKCGHANLLFPMYLALSYQLKSVKWYDGPLDTEEVSEALHSHSSSVADLTFGGTPREGATMRMRLIQRPQITTLALPRSLTWPSDLLPPHQAPFHFLPDVFEFSKFMLATPSQLISDLSRDLDDLALERGILAGLSDDVGVSFVDVADQKIRNQIEKASSLDTSFLRRQVDKAQKDLRDIRGRGELQERRRKLEGGSDAPGVPREFLAYKMAGDISSIVNPTTIPSATNQRSSTKQRRNINPPPPSTSTYYYYQAASGLPLYLHPIDIRILLSHFGEYALFPDNISFRVDAFSEGSVNDDLRKRCKYLAHLPEGADVVFVEANLEEVVGAEGLKNFENALKMRKARRKEKGRKDERAKFRAEERERERRVHEAQVSWGIPIEQEMIAPPEPVAVIQPPPASQQVSGAWGQGSFASALRSTSSRSNASMQSPASGDDADEWEMDIAWHELEQQSSGTGRKKRANKLVILGGGGGRRGR
ncbi:hypothetical protein D9757_002315 [Collybiopsis confluens]|uniref:Uncharacterized protein n=1 Tax=Collybiopsis confluens TaxID=2823264 RepID=A0A8H5MFW7_9AGAR|nr:hypothetical protein D9757_002315 [Collybiopsis confluens]